MLNRLEAARIAELQRLRVLDTAAEKAYDDLTRIAAQICGTSLALVSLVDSDRQWFKSRVGLQSIQTPREFAFCSHAIEYPDRVMIVGDTAQDERFNANPFVVNDPRIRFYAGAPLVTGTGHAVGTLCVLDARPRHLDDAQIDLLQFLAAQVVAELELRAEPALSGNCGKECQRAGREIH